MKAYLCASSALLCSLLLSAAAHAQEPAQLEEVVITAQRVEENLQRAAISVSALSGDDINKAGVTDAGQLTQLVPAMRTVPGAGPYANFNLRGIVNLGVNSFADPAIVVSLDGVPLSHPTSAHGLFYDLERVEVLKGPQGTLYGRNATGGVVNVLSRRPTQDFGGALSVDIGNYDKIGVNGAVNIPLTEDLAMRVAAQSIKRDGYFSDGTSDEDGVAARFTAAYAPTDDVKLTVIGDWSKDGGKGTGATQILSRATGGPGGFVADPWTGMYDPRVQSQYTGVRPFALAPRIQLPFQDNTYWGVTGELVMQTPVGTLTVLPSHRETETYFTSNQPTFYFGEDSASDQNSVEVRLGSGADQRLRYLAGLFYLKDKISSHQITEQITNVSSLSNQDINNETQTYAGFGQLTFSITDTLRLSGGLRYTVEEKSTNSRRWVIPGFNYVTQSLIPFPAFGTGNLDPISPVGSRRWESTTYKVGVEWEPRPDSLIYANVGTGFKAGGFFFGPLPNSYEPEEVTAYTVGSKNRFLDGTLQLNGEIFMLKYEGQQVSRFTAYPGFGNVFVTDNVGDATIKGVEIEGKYLVTRNTLLSGTVQYLDATYDKYTFISPVPVNTTQNCPLVNGNIFQQDCSGKTMPQSPEWVLMGTIEQTFPLSNGADLVASLTSRYETERETCLNYLPECLADSYTRTDASLTYAAPNNTWSVMAYVQNIEDDAVVVQTFPGRAYSNVTGGVIGATLQSPRTYGVRLSAKF